MFLISNPTILIQNHNRQPNQKALTYKTFPAININNETVVIFKTIINLPTIIEAEIAYQIKSKLTTNYWIISALEIKIWKTDRIERYLFVSVWVENRFCFKIIRVER